MISNIPRYCLSLAGLIAVAITHSSLLADPSESSGNEAKALKLFESVYGSRLRAAVATLTPNDDIELAKELIKVAGDSSGDAALVTVLYDRAASLSSSNPAGYSIADEALELLYKHVPSSSLQTLERLVDIRLRQFNESSGDQKRKAGERLIDAQVSMAQEARSSNDLDKSASSYEAALRTAGIIRSSRLDEIRNEIVTLRTEQQRSARIMQLRERILRNANDEASITELLRLLVIEEDNPSAAIAYSQMVSVDGWKSHVPLAAKSVSDIDATQALILGDWYIDLVKKAGNDAGKRMSSRAKRYYDRFLELHLTDDLLRKRVELAVKTIDFQTNTKQPLTTLKPVKHTIWLKPEPHVSPNKIWAHPFHDRSSIIEYDLGGSWNSLAGSAVLSNKGPTQGTLVFRIVGDGKELWRSQPLTKVKQPSSQEFTVSIKGVRTLQLFVDCKGEATNAWTSWDNVTIGSGTTTPAAGGAAGSAPAIDRLSKALSGTTWKFTQAKEPTTLTFKDDMTVTRSWIAGKGRWRVEGPTTVKANILGNIPMDNREVTIEFSKDGNECTMSGWDKSRTHLVRVR